MIVALTAILAALYAITGHLLGWIGAALIVASLATARKPLVAYPLLAAGALPLAVITWWSLVTPLLAVLTLLLGSVVIRSQQRRMSVLAPVEELVP